MLNHTDLAALHRDCFTTPRPWSAAEFAGLLSSPPIFIVYGDGPSFAIGRAVAGEAELLTVAVAPAEQGRGFGRQILSSFEHCAIERGSETVFLEVAATNRVAIKLYEAFGYTESGIRPKYYTASDGQKIDANVMMKVLKQV